MNSESSMPDSAVSEGAVSEGGTASHSTASDSGPVPQDAFAASGHDSITDLPAGPAEPRDTAAPDSGRDRRRAGIGLPEALLWTVGVLIVHLLGGVAAMIWIVVSHIMQTADPANPEATQAAVMALFQNRAALQSLINGNVLTLLVGEMAVFVACAVAFSLLRLGWSPHRKLGLKRIPARQLVLILGMTVPLALVCGTLHQWTTAGWESLAQHFPALHSLFEGADVNEQLKPISDQAPLGLLILVIALAPAIGEEIVFRGVIGRGLVARYGVLPGIILTSLLFASVHLHPAHIAALLPLAFVIHFVYLVTRSFWAPVMLHFANNALAAILLKISGLLEGTVMADDQGLPVWGFLIASGLVAIAVKALWDNRIEYELPDGSRWSPGHSSVEVPPSHLQAIPVQTQGHAGFCAFAMFSVFLFTGLFVIRLAGVLHTPAAMTQ